MFTDILKEHCVPIFKVESLSLDGGRSSSET